MSDVEKKLEALAGEIRALSRIVEESKRGSELPRVMSYARAAQELDISVATLKRMVAMGQIVKVERGEGFDPGIPRREILRIEAGDKKTGERKREERATPAQSSSEGEKIRAALREAKAQRKNN